MSQLSPMLKRLRPSATIAVTDKARERRAKDPSVLVVSGGEPDFDTPDHIKEAAIAAIRRGDTKYTTTSGTPALKAAIIHKFKTENGLDYSPDEIIAGTGGKQVIFNALIATISPGDEVVLPCPAWVSYADVAELAEGVVVRVKCRKEDGFKIRPAALEAAITPRTRWFVINSPCNPTGAVYSKSELRQLADVLVKHPKVMILSDDIYEHLVYDGAEFATMVEVAPELRDRTVTINGMSKAYCMTGWRLGYGAAPPWLVKAMTMLQAQTTTNPSSISQAAAVAALTGPTEFIASNNQAYRRRRDMVVNAINRMQWLSCLSPQGAIYVWIDVSRLIGQKTEDGREMKTDLDVSNFFLDAARVALVPGTGFGFSPYVRLCFAYSDEVMAEVVSRIGTTLSRLGTMPAVE
jgi:aspartate aminotransferase